MAADAHPVYEWLVMKEPTGQIWGWGCQRCGAFVFDTVKHVAWHEELRRRFAADDDRGPEPADYGEPF